MLREENAAWKQLIQGSLQYSDTLLIDGYKYPIFFSVTYAKQQKEMTPAHSHSQYEVHAVAKGSVSFRFADTSELLL